MPVEIGGIIVGAGSLGLLTLLRRRTARSFEGAIAGFGLLIFVAFVVAAASLLIQGGTLGWVVKTVKPAEADPEVAIAERAALIGLMRDATAKTVEEHADGALADQYRELVKRMEAQAKEDGEDHDVLVWVAQDGPDGKFRALRHIKDLGVPRD